MFGFRAHCSRVEYFHGYETENVRHWLIRLQNFLIVEGVELRSFKAARVLQFFLRGYAQEWYYSLSDDIRDNFSALEKALLSRFLSYEHKFRLREELEQKRQDVSESLEDYIEFIEERCHLLEISDETKLFIFVNGLRSSEMKREILMNRPKSFDKAVSIAQHKLWVDQMIESPNYFSKATFECPRDETKLSFQSNETLAPKFVETFHFESMKDLKKKLKTLKEELSSLRNLQVDDNVRDEFSYEVCPILTELDLYEENLTKVLITEERPIELFFADTFTDKPFAQSAMHAMVIEPQNGVDRREFSEKYFPVDSAKIDFDQKKDCLSCPNDVRHSDTYQRDTDFPIVRKVQFSIFPDDLSEIFADDKKQKCDEQKQIQENHSFSECGNEPNDCQTVFKTVKMSFKLNDTIWACIILYLILMSAQSSSLPKVYDGISDTLAFAAFSSPKRFPPPYIYEETIPPKPPDKFLFL